jgi:outer membrane protein
MKKILLSTAVALTLTTSLNADFLGAEVGYAVWGSTLAGNIQKGDRALDFENELGYGSHEINGFMWLYIDHPLPLIPNLKIQKTNFSDSGSSAVNTNVTFSGKSFVANEPVTSSITLDQVDIIPYWRILDNWINLDIGLNIKSIDGDIQVNSTATPTKQANADFTAILPMLYTKARFDLPFSGLSAEADISYIRYSDEKFSDLKVGIVYETTVGLGATLGYRKQSIKLDDIYGEMKIKGPYAGLFFHF